MKIIHSFLLIQSPSVINSKLREYEEDGYQPQGGPVIDDQGQVYILMVLPEKDEGK